MPEEAPMEWKLVRTSDDRLRLLAADRAGPRDLDLGPFDAACERLAEFLAEQDFGE